jgi:tRNA A-37 threonylcarbamoyl transferase component Bud32
MSRQAEWPALRALFERALELDAGGRAALLASDAAGDPGTRAAVERLLAAAGEAEGPLDRSALELLEAAAPAGDGPDRSGSDLARRDVAGRDLAGRDVGGATLVGRISAGGMGEVWLGERVVGGARRRVAVKLLRRGLDSDDLLRRFRREQETLAALHHENIVAFVDAGALADGRPYVVMEYVEGLPITEWCRERAAGVRERVALLREVCAAVAFAHQNLVLHRDLKPGNILVTGAGRPKLLDFGVAKLLAPEARAAAGRDGNPGPDADATDPGAARAPLTWRYASPEQLAGARVSAATDVHALGLILYELLCERPAFGADDAALGRARAGLRRSPPPPSTALPPGAPRSLVRALRGDLDAIVMQAIRPEPELRYPSAEALSADLGRWLEGEAVSAHRGTAAERLARVVRRRPWTAALLVVLSLCLLAGMLGALVGKQRAEREASRGWGAHAQARAAAVFLEELLVRGAALDEAGWLALDARVGAELGRWPETEALVRLALGHLALEQGRPSVAERQLERALSLDRGLNPDDTARAAALLVRARGQPSGN